MEITTAEMGEWWRSENGGSGRISSNVHNRKARARARELGHFLFYFICYFIFYFLYYFFLSSRARSVGVLETMLLAILSEYFLCLSIASGDELCLRA